MTTVASNSCASRSSSPPTTSSGSPSKCRSPLGSRTAKTSPYRLRTETARDERQRLRRGRVEPLHVVHDADEGSVFRDVGEQTQDRQADEEPIRRIAVAQTERGAKRIALRAGKALDAIQERRAQLLQPRVRELHLRLDSGRPGLAAPGRVLRPDSPATHSCQSRHPRAAPAPGLNPRAHSPPADPAPRTRCAGQAAAARKR